MKTIVATSEVKRLEVVGREVLGAKSGLAEQRLNLLRCKECLEAGSARSE